MSADIDRHRIGSGRMNEALRHLTLMLFWRCRRLSDPSLLSNVIGFSHLLTHLESQRPICATSSLRWPSAGSYASPRLDEVPEFDCAGRPDGVSWRCLVNPLRRRVRGSPTVRLSHSPSQLASATAEPLKPPTPATLRRHCRCTGRYLADLDLVAYSEAVASLGVRP